MLPVNRHILLFAVMVAIVSGCASLTVSKVNTADGGNDSTVKGQRYYLPKVVFVAAPQSDGTVSISVLYLPDKSHEYAAQPKSCFSSYTFQLVPDQMGLLSSVQYNADTTAVATQIASSAGATAAQVINNQASQAVAVQSLVNSQQATVISDQSAYSAANAALTSDTAANAANPSTTLAAAIVADQSAVAQAQAKLQSDETALQQIKISSQAIAGTAAAGTPITPAGPASLTSPTALTPNPLPNFLLPENYGAVVYQLKDKGDKEGDVSLDAVTYNYNGSEPVGTPDLPDGAISLVQPSFITTSMAKVSPSIPAALTSYSLDTGLPAVFQFDRPVETLVANLFKAVDQTTPILGALSIPDLKTIVVDISKLSPGGYVVKVNFGYLIQKIGANRVIQPGSQSVYFSVIKK
jgi:hypothetical protein